MEPVVLKNIDGLIGTITIANDHKANSLSTEVISGILSALDDFCSQELRVAIIRSKPGAKIFSAGHDISELPTDGSNPFSWHVPLEQLLRRVREVPMPVIAMCEGSVWGGACDLAVSCDLIVATPKATLAMTPAKLGLPYNSLGTSHFLGVLPIHRLKEMLFTADPMSAEEALRLGIYNRVVSPEELEEATMTLAHRIASLAPLVIQVLKNELRELGAGSPLSAQVFEKLESLREQAWRSEDIKEGIKAFFEKRSPEFKGH